MPFMEVYCQRDVFLSHNGVTVYHAYKDNDYGRRLEYWFTLSEEEESEEFDIRNLGYKSDMDMVEFMKKLIDEGKLKQGE